MWGILGKVKLLTHPPVVLPRPILPPHSQAASATVCAEKDDDRIENKGMDRVVGKGTVVLHLRERSA